MVKYCLQLIICIIISFFFQGFNTGFGSGFGTKFFSNSNKFLSKFNIEFESLNPKNGYSPFFKKFKGMSNVPILTLFNVNVMVKSIKFTVMFTKSFSIYLDLQLM
jgi:hypothetical protein